MISLAEIAREHRIEVQGVYFIDTSIRVNGKDLILSSRQ